MIPQLQADEKLELLTSPNRNGTTGVTVMAACSNSIVLPVRRRFDVFAMRPVMALALAAGCVAHAARVALKRVEPLLVVPHQN